MKVNTIEVLRSLMMICILLTPLFFTGCGNGEDSGKNNFKIVDETIPENTLWEITTLLELDKADPTPPQVKFSHTDGRLDMTWYGKNPVDDENRAFPYRISYKSFQLDRDGLPKVSGATEETVTHLEDLKGLGGLSMAQSNGTPLIAYSVHKKAFELDDADINNQGDVVIAVRDDSDNWRNEIAAYGYVSPDRNPGLADGLAGSDFSLNADEDGNALLSFQFFYEGIDSYNMAFPDLRYISQPVDNFNNRNAEAIAGDEETVEGNTYYSNGSGVQNNQGGSSKLLIDQDGNLAVVYFADNTNNPSDRGKGLRLARKIDGDWQAPEWIDKGEGSYSGIGIVDISAAVKSDGKLFIVYVVKDVLDLSGDETIPYSLRYAEEVAMVTEDESGEISVNVEWQTGIVNHTSINGRFCSVALDSEDNPVIAYFDEMNFSQNRFFSRIKVSSRSSKGAWSVDVITPEDIGLSNKTSPHEVSPGSHDVYYIGKYNYLWVDANDRVNICSYSTITNKVYHFIQK